MSPQTDDIVSTQFIKLSSVPQAEKTPEYRLKDLIMSNI